MKKTLVLAVVLTALFNLSATTRINPTSFTNPSPVRHNLGSLTKPSPLKLSIGPLAMTHPFCGPNINIVNGLFGMTVTSVDISGPGAGTFTTPSFTSSYATVIGTFSPTFVIHYASAITHPGIACLSDDGTSINYGSAPYSTGATTITLVAATLTCTNYTLRVAGGTSCPAPR